MAGRYDTPRQQAARDLPVGDLGFRGLRMKTPREQLPDGYYPRAENKRIGKGLETRPGTRTPLWANFYNIPQGFIGSGRYSNPNGEELGMLAFFTAVEAIRAGATPITIPLAEPFGGGGVTVDFTQHFDKIVAHRSDPSKSMLVWDGLDYTTGFIVMPPPAVTGSGFLGMPNPPWSINFQDRAWFPIPGEDDSLGATDKGDVTTWDSILHKFRVNTGTADKIVGAYPFFDSSLIVGKRRSIDILQNIPDDLGDLYLEGVASPPPPRAVVVSTQVGIVARKSGIMAGATFMFLSDAGRWGGIYQIITDQHGRYVVDPIPVSEEIEPLIQRINWPYADKAVAVVDGRYAKWMVPMDGAAFNNAVLVFNLATREWESVDFWNTAARQDRNGRLILYDNPMRMDSVFHLDSYGNAQLFAVDHELARVRLMSNGLDDQFEVAKGNPPEETRTYPIQCVMESRGLSIVSLTGETEQRANYVAIALATLAPSLTFTELIDGADGNEIEIGTPSPTVLGREEYQTAKRNYVLDNSNDDADEVGRDDYSVQMGDGILLHEGGVRPQRVWPWEKKIILNASGRFVSFRVSNTGGICQVRSILYNAEATRTTRNT